MIRDVLTIIKKYIYYDHVLRVQPSKTDLYINVVRCVLSMLLVTVEPRNKEFSNGMYIHWLLLRMLYSISRQTDTLLFLELKQCSVAFLQFACVISWNEMLVMMFECA